MENPVVAVVASSFEDGHYVYWADGSCLFRSQIISHTSEGWQLSLQDTPLPKASRFCRACDGLLRDEPEGDKCAECAAYS